MSNPERLSWRKSSQDLMPAEQPFPTPPGYRLYPGFQIPPRRIERGYQALAETLSDQRLVVLDGDQGVLWERLRGALQNELGRAGLQVHWLDVRRAMKSAVDINHLIAPYLGGDDPLFGTRFDGNLSDFFDPNRLADLKPNPRADLNILYGPGAALAGWDGFLVYADLPKNEVQFRARAGSITNLGANTAAPPKAMYKRFYFVDWPALRAHKAALRPQIDLLLDAQRPHDPTFMHGDDMRIGLTAMSRNYFRVRPWFEPGAWGGQWIKQHMPHLPQDVPNYAWSFELIVPENGLLFESDGLLLELAFDWLMFQATDAVLGHGAPRFGTEFPIRFDFLDTVDGGNLSVQCHPRPDFIRRHFGEQFTQDETYYILDCAPGAQVYLGFQNNVDPEAFRATLETSAQKGTPVDIEQFVQVHPAHKHDLFLIPSGTIHASGQGNLVLEISATPYIFTFKLYDWLRLDLDGRPRPLNLERGFENLVFERQGDSVPQQLIARPILENSGRTWQKWHLPTHAEHFYDIYRYDFEDSVSIQTHQSPHVLSLVEGQSLLLETADGLRARFNYAETFVVPAAAQSYRLINQSNGPAKVVVATLKPPSDEAADAPEESV